MKRSFFLIGLLLVVLASLALAGFAAPPPGGTCSEQCSGPLGDFFLNQGACVSACNVCTNNAAADKSALCLCKQIKGQGLLELFGFKNLAQCVKTFS
ncbi:MAG TPA: hypothetical protein VLV83_16555 [Acidobacteriota bacterium]|nr:hypothetical protein [Acidobacteriota bacterium]